MKRLISVIGSLFLVCLATAAGAQESGEETANLSRGFHAEKVYDFLGLDTVERFSGNLNLRIPIGQEFHNGHLSYQLALYYNSHIWDFYIMPSSIPPDPEDPSDTHCPFASSTISYPAASNAGFGWNVSLGSFTRCTTVEYPCPEAGAPAAGVYVAPDGGRHKWYVSSSNSNTYFTKDGSFLRLTVVNSYTQNVEFPDGTRHTFSKYAPQSGTWQISDTSSSVWRLTQMSDHFGNHVDFTYETSGGYPEVVTIHDGDRQHQLFFTTGAYFSRVLDHVDLAAFGGHGALSTYRFEHQDVNVAPGGGDNATGHPLLVSLLTAVTLPDGHAFRMKDPDPNGALYYDTTIPAPTVGTQIPGWPWSAVLGKLALPTGGSIEWTYDESDVENAMTREACSGVSTPITLRVMKRTLHDTNGAGGTWEYRYASNGDERCQLACGPNQIGLCFSGARQLTSTSIAPDGVANVTYYSFYWKDKCPATVDQSRPWKRAEYGLPLTHWNDAYGTSINALPSSDTRSAPPAVWADVGPIAEPTADPLFHRTYVRYEGDLTGVFSTTDFNWRRTYEHTMFSMAPSVDPETHTGDATPYYATCAGGRCFTEKIYYKWDGFGHFKRSTTNSNLTATVVPSATSGPPQQTSTPSRTVFTDYPTTLDANNDWVLDTPAEKCVADELSWRTADDIAKCQDLTGASTTLLSYDRATGLLNAQRALSTPDSATRTLSDSDVLAVFGYDHGYLSLESYYGGNQTNWQMSDPFSSSGSPAYEIQHHHGFTTNGLLQSLKSQYTGVNTPTEDVDYDVWTGNIGTSRDGSGLATTYAYDSSGRLNTITPPSPLAATSIAYSSPADPPRVTLSAVSTTGAGSFKKIYDYDGLGRIIKESTLMPDAPGAAPDTTFSQVVTAYNDAGQLASVSTQQDSAAFNPNYKTTYTNYDATGAACTITAPDGSKTLTSRHAAGHLITVIQDSAGNRNIRRTTDNDAFGRLFTVHEPSGPTSMAARTGDDVKTTYGYDWADHLAAVDMQGDEGTQTRRFVYDRRGFLTQETHPESGVTKYDDYDARGHAHHRVAGADNGPFDLTFGFDQAERLTSVWQRAGAHFLKEYHFADSNLPSSGYSAGKLLSATRHNYITGGDAQVTETYTYGGAGGAVSQKETSFSMPGMPAQTFHSQFTYNDFGSLATLTYPTCTISCGGTGIGTIQRTFANGRLSNVSSVDGIPVTYGSLSYNANGTVGTVTHPGGVKDIYTPDPTGLPRVKSIAVTQFCVGPSLNTSEPADQSIVSGGQTTLHMTAIAGAQYVWYQGQSGDTSHVVSTTNGASFPTPILTGNTSYWARVSAPDSSGQTCSSDSRTATITVKPCTEVSIVAQPQDASISSGHTATLSVVAQGVDNLTYQWYQGISGNTTNALAGKTSATLTTDALNATTSYWVRITAATCVRDSATATVHVCHAPVITVAPVSQTIGVPDGQSVIATASVTATGDDLSYTWNEVNADGSLSLPLGNAPTFSIAISGTTARTFKVTVSNLGMSLPAECTGSDSRTVTFTPVRCNVTFYTVPGDVTIFPGSNTFPLSVGVWATSGVRFDWYHGINGNAVHFAGGEYTTSGPANLFGGCTIDLRSDVLMSNVTGALNAPYDIYWCVVSRTDATCSTGVSTRNIYVSYAQSCPLPPVTVNPTDIVVGPGDTTTLSALADLPRLRYQWYEGQSGDTTKLLPGQTQSTMAVGSTADHYWCRVTNECGTASEDSPTVTVSVKLAHKTCTPPVIVQQPQSVDIAAGTSSLLSVDATDPNTTLQYTWLVEGPGDPVPNPSSRQTTVSPRVSTKYYAKISNVPGDDCSMTVESARAIVHIRTCSSINLTSEPTSATIYSGTTATLSVVASSSDTIQYQWYRGPDGDIPNSTLIDGATLSSYTTPPLSATTSYWVRMTTASCTIDSTTAIVTVCDPPVITHQPVGGDLTTGQAFFFSAVASGSNLTYEWHEGRPGNEGPTIGWGDSVWFRPQHTSTYFMKAIGTCGPSPVVATTDVITVTVCSPPVITTQPASTTIFSGRTATLNVVASESDPNTPVSYQWFEVGGSAVGTNSPTFTTPPMTAEKSYTVHIQSGACGIDSDTATVSVCDLAEIVDVGTSYNIEPSQRVLLNAVSGPSGSVYMWYRGHSGDYAGSVAIDGGTDVRTVYVSPSVTTTYWASITRGSCVSRTTDFTVNVCVPAITAPPHPPANPVNSGASVSLSVESTISNVTYQWYTGTSGDTSHPITGATTASITVNPTATTSYWARVTGTCGISADSAAATVVVCAPTTITGVTPAQWVTLGYSTLLSVSASGTNLTYQWYTGNPGDTSHPVTGATSASYAATPQNTTTYWTRVSSTCGTADSAGIVVSVCGIPVIKTQPQSAQIYTNGTATLSVGATNPTTNPNGYQWYRGAAGDTSTPVGTGSVFTTPPLTAATSYWVRVSNGPCSTVDSQAALVTVNACNTSVAAAAGVQSAVGQSVVLTVPATVVAPVQNSLQLAGTSYATVSSSPVLDIAGPLTVEAWIKVSAIGAAQGIVERYGATNSTSGGYALRITNTGKLHFFIGYDSTTAGQSDTIDGATTITAGQWHHVAGVYDGAQLRVYLDGVSDGAKSTTLAPGTGTANLIIGASGNNAATGAMFSGLIDEVRVSTDALYVAAFAPAQHLTASSTTVGLWKFDGQTLVDSSSNALNASASSSLAFAEDSPGAKQYAWYQGASGDVSHPVSSFAPPTVVTVAPTATTQYWYQVKDGACTANSAAATVNVCIPQITQQPANTNITNGQSATLTVAANTAGVVYQWYAGASGVTTSPIAGATSASVVVSPTTTTSYWARATSTCARTVDSAAATVTVCQPPAIASQSGSTWIARGSSTQLSVTATGTGLSYQWYGGAVNDTSAPLPSVEPIYNAAPLNTASYWVRVTGSCGTANSAQMTVSVCATPSITTQPSPASITTNNTATLTVAATDATTTPMTYQWYVGSSGVTTSPISGATSASYTTPALTTTTSYWVRVSNGTCAPADSTTATVTVCQPPSVTSQTPTSYSTSPGSIVTLRATGSGSGITYQWYIGSTGDTSTPINTATQSSCNVAPSNTTNYWVRVLGSCGSANSPTMTVYVCAPPAITSQPGSQTIYYNTAATMSVAATESTTTGMTYQWYRGATGDASAPIAGATATTYTTPALTTTTSYWVRISAGTCSTDSATATVTVCSFTATVGTAASQQTAVGQATSVSSPVGGTRYAFYQGNSGDFSHALTGWTASSTLSVAPTVTTSYWNQVDNGVCIANSATTTINVCVPQFTQQPASQTVPSGQSATLTAVANTAGVTYQWYVGTSGSTTSPVSGATGSSLTITPTSNTSYWVRATSSCGRTVDSATATITLCSPPAITGQPQNAPPISSGQSSTLRVFATGSNISYQWYYGQSGTTTSPINGATSSVLTAAASQTTYYWVRITGQCGSIDSAAAMISVFPNILQQPSSASLNSGSTATLSVNANGSYLHYSWRYSNGNPIPGAPDAPVYIASPVTAAFDAYCSVTSGIAPVNSNMASITLCDGLQYTSSYVQNNGGCQRYVQVGFSDYPESWSWYRGARGDTSAPVGNSSTLLVCISGPTTYWVRVTRTDPNTGETCYTDSPAVAVQ